MTDRAYLDTETFPIGPGAVAPRIVCVQILRFGRNPLLLSRQEARTAVEELLRSDCILVFQNAAYDMACICATWPDFVPLVFQAYADGRVEDVAIRDKMLNLALTGRIATSMGRQLLYNLADIAYRRIGHQMEGKDKDDPESWRLRFAELDGLPASEYPAAAVEYALDDVRVLPLVYAAQEREAERVPLEKPFRAASLSCAADFALYLKTCQGIAVDPKEHARLDAWVRAELSEEKLEPLYQSGILRRPQPPRPYLNGCGKMTAGEPASVNTMLLKQIVYEVSQQHEVPIILTDSGLVAKRKGEPFTLKHVSTKEEAIESIALLHPALVEYKRRQEFLKIVTTELPRMLGADGRPAQRVHANFDVLKETGRTSSFAGKLYPSFNGQNVDPRAKTAYVADPGWVICSVDYSTIELVTLGETILDLADEGVLWYRDGSRVTGSSHADLINAGVDCHAYLGAQMLSLFEPGWAQERGWTLPSDQMGAYELFLGLQKAGDDGKALYKHWRTFAKPVGLGYPGGLGPTKMAGIARSAYQIQVSVEECSRARDIWHSVHPEMRAYFDWITRSQVMEHPVYQGPDEEEDQDESEDRYWYLSPMGMLRSNTTYCSAANGRALQTPAAEGAKHALFEISRACYDPTRRSILYGCRPWNFVHDETLAQIPKDAWMHERAHEIARLWREGMERVIKRVKVKAAPALMERWDKRAETVTDENGRVVIWAPKASV